MAGDTAPDNAKRPCAVTDLSPWTIAIKFGCSATVFRD